MTIEEKDEAIHDLWKCLTEAERYFNNGNDFFMVQSGAWEIKFDMISQSKAGCDEEEEMTDAQERENKESENER